MPSGAHTLLHCRTVFQPCASVSPSAYHYYLTKAFSRSPHGAWRMTRPVLHDAFGVALARAPPPQADRSIRACRAMRCVLRAAVDSTGWALVCYDTRQWRKVDAAQDLLQLFHEGQRNMVYAETKMNKHSSRSHAVLQVGLPRATKAAVAQRFNARGAPVSRDTVRCSEVVCAAQSQCDRLLL